MQDRKKQKVDAIPRMACIDAVGSSLYNARELVIRDYGDNVDKIEVEARLGMIVFGYRRWQSSEKARAAVVVEDQIRSRDNLLFKSGIDPIYAKSLKSRLSETFKSDVLPLQIVRCSANNTRWQVNANGQVTMSEQKSALVKTDIALLAHHYDLRINVANENDIAARNSAVSDRVDYSRWTQERRKRRTTFHHKTWKLDFTEVDVVEASGKKSHEIEFELEMLPEITKNWLSLSKSDEVYAETRRIATDLLVLIDLLVPFDEDTGKETPLTDVSNSTANLERQIAILHSSVLGHSKLDFIGSMPVNLSRQNLNNVHNSRYHITEKSDGIRYLVYVLKDSGLAVFVNRSKKIFRFPGSDLLGSWLRPNSILDGELVYSKAYKEEVFMVFDVLAWDGKSLLETAFSERKEFIQATVIPAYARGYGVAASSKQDIVCLKLIRKIFYEKGQFADLLRKISFEGGERCFNDGERRHHTSDGIIFQPDGPYVFGKHFDLLKWKWPELRSIDLRVSVEEHRETKELAVYLKCSADGGEVNCTLRGSENVGLGVYDTYRLLADMEGAGLGVVQGNGWRGSNAIAEVAYDVSVGMWSYMQLRRDKNEPNFIISVMGVFTEQAESICIEELKYLMTAATYGLENDYDTKLQRKKDELLREQESQLRSGSGR